MFLSHHTFKLMCMARCNGWSKLTDTSKADKLVTQRLIKDRG